jgi:hypothetical protein
MDEDGERADYDWTWFLAAKDGLEEKDPSGFETALILNREDEEDDEEYLPRTEENYEDEETEDLEEYDEEPGEDLHENDSEEDGESIGDDDDLNDIREDESNSNEVDPMVSFEQEEIFEQPTRSEMPLLRARNGWIPLNLTSRTSTITSNRSIADPRRLNHHIDTGMTSADQDDTIAMRTRRHWDLSKVTIDDLETFLEDAPPEPVLRDYDETYLSFLTSLRDDHLIPEDEDDETKDQDYVYEPLEIVPDEFRYDSSVQIPRSELQELLKEACHESYFKEIFVKYDKDGDKMNEDIEGLTPSTLKLYPFDEELMRELTRQFQNHVQLLLQTYALASLLDGETQAIRASLFFLDDLHMRKHEWQQTTRSYASIPSGPTTRSPFDLDCLDVIELVKSLGKIKPQFFRDHVRWTRPKYLSPPPIFYQCLNLMKEDRDDSLIVPIHLGKTCYYDH